MSLPSAKRHANPTAEAAALLFRLGLVLVSIVLPAVAIGSRRSLFVLMPIGAVLILLSALIDSRGEGMAYVGEHLRSLAGVTALFLVCWAAMSLIWTPFPLEAAPRLGKEVATIILSLMVCAFLPERTRISNLNLLPIGVGCSALIAAALALGGPALLKLAQDGENSTLERGMLGIIVLLWPALAALGLRGRWNWAGLVAILVAVASILVWSPAGMLGLMVGCLVFAVSAKAAPLASRMIGTVFAVLILLAPLIPLGINVATASLAVRPDDFIGTIQASARIWSKIVGSDGWRLLTGHGIDSATRGMVGGFLPVRTPHGILFELWFELGALGALAMAVLVFLGFIACGRQTAAVAPFLLSGLASAVTISSLGFSLSQLWWVTMLGIVSILATHVLRGQYLTRRPQFEAAGLRTRTRQEA